MLEVSVQKHFQSKEKVEFLLDISFTVGDGFTVLTGASGAGKTTVLRLIAGILTPETGSIKLDSQTFFDSARKINLPIQKRRVGFVFQDYALFPHLTAEKNIAFGAKLRGKLKTDKAREMLALFRLEHIRNRLPREMSGGEQQRVALARALASAPHLVLLDEPLSAVDVETRAKLLDEIENAQRQTNVPFVYVTHNEAEAIRLGRHRLKIESGKVIR